MADLAATKPNGAWARFWYSSGNAVTFGIFRFLFGIAVLVEIGTTRARSQFAIEGGFHYPYLPFIKPVPESVYNAIHTLEYPFAALLALGILPRISAAVLFGLQGYIFFTDRLNFRNHPYFFLLILLLLAFSRAGGSFSLPALVRRIRKRAAIEIAPDPVVAPLTIQRMIQVQVSIVYLYAALHKITPYYLSGSVLARMLEQPFRRDCRHDGHLGLLGGDDCVLPALPRPGNASAALGARQGAVRHGAENHAPKGAPRRCFANVRGDCGQEGQERRIPACPKAMTERDSNWPLACLFSRDKLEKYR
ncbi:MAG: HTTM domain-containing protein [Gemmatimonadota bacterium]